ncbi:hypothetical protein T492DRAFT_936441 [Pavlovales sp. CCMP2436]|nr:hypothetical protein T492DRAFT_936441 [Pavlovales sp. CCMP2436]
MMRAVLLAACVGMASAFAPQRPLAAQRVRPCVSMSCAAVAPAMSPVDAAIGALAGLLGDLTERMGQIELPNIMMSMPNRKGPSNKARAGVSGFFARKNCKTGAKIIKARRKKGRKNIIPSPGRHPIHGL